MYCTRCNRSFRREQDLAQHNSAKYSPFLSLLLVSQFFSPFFHLFTFFFSHGRHNFGTDRALQPYNNEVYQPQHFFIVWLFRPIQPRPIYACRVCRNTFHSYYTYQQLLLKWFYMCQMWERILFFKSLFPLPCSLFCGMVFVERDSVT